MPGAEVRSTPWETGLPYRYVSCALGLTAVLIAGCDARDSDVDEIGVPASFSPAQEVLRTDDRTVRCNTVHSLTLPQRIVDRFDLTVDRNTAVVSCSLQVAEDGAVRNLPALVSGTATALAGNISSIDFKEVVEEETVSYVGTFAMQAKAGVRFDITVVDPQTGVHYRIDFEQTAV